MCSIEWAGRKTYFIKVGSPRLVDEGDEETAVSSVAREDRNSRHETADDSPNAHDTGVDHSKTGLSSNGK